jgi:hypothetical protein
MKDSVIPRRDEDDKGPTEKLRDDAKSDAGELVPEESAVPGAQKPGNEEIKEEQQPNTE